MRQYELTYLISPDLKDGQAKEVSEQIIGLLQEKGGILRRTEPLKMRRLGYALKPASPKGEKLTARQSCFLGWILFQLNPAYLAELKEKINKLENVLRVLLICPKARKISPRETPFRRPTRKEPKIKVELKEIEKKLDELLGE